MKRITIQLDGRLAFAGQIDRAVTGFSQVNGRGVIQSDLDQPAANTDALPQVQPETGLLGAVRIMTPDGKTAVEDLAPGNAVLTADGDVARVAHILRSPTTRNAICLRAPYYGLDHDVVLGFGHRIAVTSHIAEYLFGEETVLVPAWVLKDGRRAQYWEMTPKSHLYQVQLDRPAALQSGRCAVESMPKSGQSIGKILTDDEARCFAAEHKSGFQT